LCHISLTMSCCLLLLIVLSSASETAESLETLKIDSENCSTVKDAAADNDWVSFD